MVKPKRAKHKENSNTGSSMMLHQQKQPPAAHSALIHAVHPALELHVLLCGDNTLGSEPLKVHLSTCVQVVDTEMRTWQNNGTLSFKFEFKFQLY